MEPVEGGVKHCERVDSVARSIKSSGSIALLTALRCSYQILVHALLLLEFAGFLFSLRIPTASPWIARGSLRPEWVAARALGCAVSGAFDANPELEERRFPDRPNHPRPKAPLQAAPRRSFKRVHSPGISLTRPWQVFVPHPRPSSISRTACSQAQGSSISKPSAREGQDGALCSGHCVREREGGRDCLGQDPCPWTQDESKSRHGSSRKL